MHAIRQRLYASVDFPYLQYRTIVICDSRLRHANGTTFMSTAGQLLHIARASGASVFTIYAVYLG